MVCWFEKAGLYFLSLDEVKARIVLPGNFVETTGSVQHSKSADDLDQLNIAFRALLKRKKPVLLMLDEIQTLAAEAGEHDNFGYLQWGEGLYQGDRLDELRSVLGVEELSTAIVQNHVDRLRRASVIESLSRGQYTFAEAAFAEFVREHIVG